MNGRNVCRVPVLIMVLAASCTTQDTGLDPSAQVRPGLWRVRLSWTTETESNAFGFYIHRADRPDGEMRVLNTGHPLPAAGTTTIPQRYCYYDLDVKKGRTYYYKLEQADLDGTSRFIVGDPEPVPGVPKPLTGEEAEEIQAFGPMYRQEQR